MVSMMKHFSELVNDDIVDSVFFENNPNMDSGGASAGPVVAIGPQSMVFVDPMRN